MVGNKTDLNERRQVSAQEAANAGKSSVKLARTLGIPYIESSARDGTNVEQVFLGIGKLVLESMQSSNKLNRKI